MQLGVLAPVLVQQQQQLLHDNHLSSHHHITSSHHIIMHNHHLTLRPPPPAPPHTHSTRASSLCVYTHIHTQFHTKSRLLSPAAMAAALSQKISSLQTFVPLPYRHPPPHPRPATWALPMAKTGKRTRPPWTESQESSMLLQVLCLRYMHVYAL